MTVFTSVVTFSSLLSRLRFPRFQFFLRKCSVLQFGIKRLALPLSVLFSTVSAPDTPPQFLHARKLSDSEVELSWQPPLEANSDVLYYVVRVW